MTPEQEEYHDEVRGRKGTPGSGLFFFGFSAAIVTLAAIAAILIAS